MLVGASYVVHFRKVSARLDRNVLRQARETYGTKLPVIVEEYMLGNLWEYKITRMQGIPVHALRTNLTGRIDGSPCYRTVRDFARLVPFLLVLGHAIN